MVSQVDTDAATELFDPLLMRARARVGTTLRGKWRLDVLLGVGGMAAVYATTHRNGARAAVKLLHTELAVNSQVRSRFLREGYVANAVGHEGAVKVLDDDTAEDGSLYLVTELLDGETLEDRRVRSGGRLSEDDVLAVADQLLDVLTAAHAKGIVHRDLKPENVFLTRRGQVKVLDFGIARLRELSTASTATKSGATMGTPAFMPPEQARALWDEVDARSDLWAVGATMFNLLTGQIVHQGRTTNEVLLAAMTKEPQRLSVAAPSVSPAVAHVVDRALAFQRDKRWPDAQRMQEAVRRAYHDRNGSPISTAPRLMVPDVVPNRTMPSAQGRPIAPQQATTGQPVESGRGKTVPGPSSRRFAGMVFGGVAAVGIVVASTVWVTSAARRSPEPTSAPLPAATATPTSPSTTAAFVTAATTVAAPPATASAPPETAAIDLPSAAPTPPPPPKPAVTWRPPAPTTAPTSAVKPSCVPPYTIDAAGKKHFKAECL